jgi:hypothetical protein
MGRGARRRPVNIGFAGPRTRITRLVGLAASALARRLARERISSCWRFGGLGGVWRVNMTMAVKAVRPPSAACRMCERKNSRHAGWVWKERGAEGLAAGFPWRSERGSCRARTGVRSKEGGILWCRCCAHVDTARLIGGWPDAASIECYMGVVRSRPREYIALRRGRLGCLRGAVCPEQRSAEMRTGSLSVRSAPGDWVRTAALESETAAAWCKGADSAAVHRLCVS